MEIGLHKKKITEKSEKEKNEDKKIKVKALVLDNIAQKMEEEEFLALSKTDRKRIET